MRVGKLPVKGGDVDFPGSPMVKTPYFHYRGTSLIPGQGTKIPHATQHGHKIGINKIWYIHM